MDFFGNGTLVEQSQLNEVLQIKADCYTFEKFRHTCILSGCDYLPSLSGIGLVKANKVFKLARQPVIEVLLKKIPSYLKMKLDVPKDYIDGFIKAENTFLYQLVFDPLTRQLVPLNPYPPEIGPETLTYAGPMISQTQALQIALGNMDISTKKKIADFNPDTFKPKQFKKSQSLDMLSIWDKNYHIRSKISQTLSNKKANTCNLIGKEKLVPFQVKRKRDEDSKDVKLDKELASIYDNNNDQIQPSPKFRKHNYSPLKTGNKDNRSPTVKAAALKSPTVSKSPCKNHGTAVTASDVFNLSTSPTENELKIPPPSNVKKNCFAIDTTNKSKFTLNIRKCEVRSRYFANKEDVNKIDAPIKTCDSNTDIRNGNNSQVELVTPKSEPSFSSTPDENYNETPEVHTLSSPKHDAVKRSLFSWSKFKFNKIDKSSVESGSSDDTCLKMNMPLNRQASILSPNRTVNKMSSYFDTVEKPALRNNVLVDLSDEKGPVNKSVAITSPAEACGDSTVSSYFSDVFVEKNVNTAGDDRLMSPGLLETCSDVIVLDDVHEETKHPLLKISKSAMEKTPKSVGLCRVSGLSKGRKKSAVISNQKNIKDMFSRFVHSNNK